MLNTTTWGDQGVFIDWEGELSAFEIQRSNNEIYANPRFDTMQYQIVDLLKVTKTSMVERDSEVLASLDKSSSSFFRSKDHKVLVALITDDAFIKILSEKYRESLAGSNWVCEIFEEKEEAVAWVSSQLNITF